MSGMLAISLAGHDKGKVYVIINEVGEYIYLCDGKNRPLDKLKQKNKKHVQVIKNILDLEVVKQKILQNKITNENIKYIIKQHMQK